ncbi:response regulator [Planctobacterium marinum]|uniref:response regulator n=1 Tax=Planctobacterium marinum TaxID=1631968 RepID=UPI001E419213|nr:response regulator [Planctobacterium marinum]MCC2604231.1 response regulator [Planctobacterium marinum]
MPKLNLTDKRVIIVDDQRPFLLMLKGIISKLGVRSLRIVQSAEGAIADCKKEKFDVVIADLHLGTNKKNGYQLIEQLRIQKLTRADTVYMMVSGDSHRPIVLGSIERNPDDYIIKPFSQAQLLNRLAKAFEKKQALRSIHLEVHKQNWEGAIVACKTLLETATKYRQSIILLMTELYWRVDDFDAAHQLLQEVLEQKNLPWAQVAMARTKLLMGDYEESIKLARQIVSARLLALEGHDILAQSYMALERYTDAMAQIRLALDMSPYSINRQYLGAAIGRINQDYEFAKQCCKELFEQSKRSVHRDLAHMCNFVRSIIDVAENADDKGKKNKYQQEAMLTLQRLRSDELVIRSGDEFSFDAFANLITGRINSLDGKSVEAKNNLSAAQKEIEQKFEAMPMVLAPDTISLLVKVGEFDQAKILTDDLRASDYRLDDNIEYMLEQVGKEIESQSGKFEHYNQKGLDCFNGGKYQAAFEAFGHALKYSQVNADVALNLLNCSTRLMEQTTKPDLVTIVESKKTIKILEGIALSAQQSTEFLKLKSDLSQYMELK